MSKSILYFFENYKKGEREPYFTTKLRPSPGYRPKINESNAVVGRETFRVVAKDGETGKILGVAYRGRDGKMKDFTWHKKPKSP